MGLEFFTTPEQIKTINSNVDAYFNKNKTLIEDQFFVSFTIILILFNSIVDKKERADFLSHEYNNFKDRLDDYARTILIFVIFISTGPLLLLMSSATKLIMMSPKGFLGSIGIVFFILGNALQLWSTFE